MILAAVVFWVFFGVVSARIASSRGRSGVGWFLLGVLFGPFGLVVALLPSAEATHQTQARQEGLAPGWRKCPFCAEAVRAEALVCRYCQQDLNPSPGGDAVAPGVDVPADPDLDLSESEAAEAIGVSLGTLRGYLKSGRLTSRSDYRITVGELVKAGFVIRHLPPRR